MDVIRSDTHYYGIIRVVHEGRSNLSSLYRWKKLTEYKQKKLSAYNDYFSFCLMSSEQMFNRVSVFHEACRVENDIIGLANDMKSQVVFFSSSRGSEGEPMGWRLLKEPPI